MTKQYEFDAPRPPPAQCTRAELGVSEGSPVQELDGVSLAWEESGTGVPVVCLHAAGHGAGDFRPLLRQSPAGCRLLLLDWPSHGRSSLDVQPFTVERCSALLAGFLRARGLHDPILLGTEFGAAVALAFALRHPEQVRGLVLCQPAGLLAPVAPRRSLGIDAAVARLARLLFRQPIHTPAELQDKLILTLRAAHDPQLTQAPQSLAALESTMRAGLAQVASPVLVTLAASSRAYPLKPFEQLLAPLLDAPAKDQQSHIKLAIFSGSHSPLWESPARLARILSGFAAASLPLDRHTHVWTLAAADWPTRGMNQWKCTHAGCHAEVALPIGRNPSASGSSHS